MEMIMRVTNLLLMPLLLAGCIDQLHEEAHALTYIDAQTTSSSGEPVPPTTTQAATGGVQTVTGETTLEQTTAAIDDTGTTATTGEAIDLPPTIDLFTATPGQLSEAGKSHLELQTSADVVQVRLFQNDAQIADLKPSAFPYTYEAFSAKSNGDPHTFRVEVTDAGGQTAMKELKLKVLLPASGSERCLFQDMGAKGSAILGLVHGTDAIVAVGWRDTGAGPRIVIWKLDKKSCTVLPGWPRTIASWNPLLAGQTSRAVGVALDESGYIAVAANLWPGGKPQLYAALFTPEGVPIWERTGDVGEEAAGIATGADHRVFVVGVRRTSDNPIRTDARIWGFQFVEGIVTEWVTDLKAPFTADEADPDLKNLRSERARAVLVQDDEVFVVGEREFTDGNLFLYTRTFVARYYFFGQVVGSPWTSPGDYLPHEGMNAIGRCGADLIAGGWSRDKPPGSTPVPLMRWIKPDGTSTEGHSELLPTTQTFGIGCDREGKIVSGGTGGGGELNTQVFASWDLKKPPLIYDAGVAGDDATLAFACDPQTSFCAGGGYRAPLAFVRVYHP